MVLSLESVRIRSSRSPFTLPYWLLVPGASAFVVSLAAYVMLIKGLGFDAYDLSVYLAGGEAFRHGDAVYSTEIHSDYGIGFFTYPPVTLLLFAPLSFLPTNVVFALMLLLGVASLVGVIWLSLRLVGAVPGRGSVGASLAMAAGAIWLQPVFDTLYQGQINLILILLILLDIALDGRPRWPTGILIGVAVAAKITPAIFIVYLLLQRKLRAAAVATGTWLILTALGFAAARSDSVEFWFHGTFADSARVASPLTNASVFNQSLRGVLLRLLGGGAGEIAWFVLALLVAIGGFAVALVARRTEGRLAGAVACAITGLLISPLSWHEHWVWMVPVLVLLVDLGRRLRHRAPTLAGAIPVIVAVPFLMWPLPIAPGRVGAASILSPARHMWEDEGSRGPVPLVAGAAYVLVGLTLLAVGGWIFSQIHRPDALRLMVMPSVPRPRVSHEDEPEVSDPSGIRRSRSVRRADSGPGH